MITTLEKVLQYQNQNVTERFQQLFNIPETEIQIIFDDLKRWLWLYAKYNHQRKAQTDIPDIYISMSMIILDEMWHSFILNTEGYHQFCQEHFGEYLHHPPIIPKYMKNLKTIGEQASDELILEEMIAVVYDELGGEVAVRWFDEYLKYETAGVH